MLRSDPNITDLIEDFTNQIVAAVNAAAAQRIQAALAGVFDLPQTRAPIAPARPIVTAPAPAVKRARPKQLCPVPGCKNIAAPVFGMVCAEHRRVAKSKIAKYRAERKANTAPAGLAKPAVAAKPKKSSLKMAQARKLQGQYLGALHGLVEPGRSRVRQLATEKGVAEALKLAMALKKAAK